MSPYCSSLDGDPNELAHAMERLRLALLSDGRDDLERELILQAKGGCVTVTEGDGAPLCRLRRAVGPEAWILEMYSWHAEEYQERQHGSLEACLWAAIDAAQL